MEKHYRFAGVEVTARIPDQWMYDDDRDLAEFRVSEVSDPHTYTFEAVDTLPAPAGKLVAKLPGVLVYREADAFVRYIGTVENGWEKAYMRVQYGDKNHFVQVKTNDVISRMSAKMVLNSIAPEHFVTEAGGFIFHCSYINYEGKAIVFTAPSGTGKSTQADLWQQYRGAGIINGDRAVIRTIDNYLYAAGIPFSGSSSYCLNCTLPLAAVVYLSQAPNTTIRKLRGMEAFVRIWEGVSVNTWVKEDLERVSDTVQLAAAEVPVYHLACTPDESAVTALEEALRKQGIV